jgi:hypothetical protein
MWLQGTAYLTKMDLITSVHKLKQSKNVAWLRRKDSFQMKFVQLLRTKKNSSAADKIYRYKFLHVQMPDNQSRPLINTTKMKDSCRADYLFSHDPPKVRKQGGSNVKNTFHPISNL